MVDDFESYADDSQQPTGFMQMMGAWELHRDATNATNMVLKQMATQVPLDNWRGRFTFHPATVIGMREWQDVAIGASFRLPAAGSGGSPGWPAVGAGVCLATRANWVYNNGVFLCIDASGRWNTSYGYTNPRYISNLTGTVASPPKGGAWFHLSLTTLQGTASATYNGAALFTGVPIEDVDTGFAGISTTGYYAAEVDNVKVTQRPLVELPGACCRLLGVMCSVIPSCVCTVLPHYCAPCSRAKVLRVLRVLRVPGSRVKVPPRSRAAALACADAGSAVVLCAFVPRCCPWATSGTRTRPCHPGARTPAWATPLACATARPTASRPTTRRLSSSPKTGRSATWQPSCA